MKIFAFSVSFALFAAAAVEAQFPLGSILAPTIDCRYGIPARFDEGILKYPDFTVRFTTRTEFARDDRSSPWVKYVFEVLDTEHRTIGGDITVNSEERANGRRFDVHGKIYIAEMFYSTADLSESEQPSLKSRLARDEIVVWDESAASKHNPKLLRIWKEENVDPAARYSVSNAYAGGVLLPGFGPAFGKIDYGQNGVARDSLRVEKVAVVDDDKVAPVAGTLECAYGSRVFFGVGPLKYPDFTVLLTSREETDTIDVRTSAVSYQFAVFDHTGKRTFFRFSTSNLANGCRFEAGGSNYFAEMFFTTAVPQGNPSLGEVNIPLGSGELIVWNEESAKVANPRILSAWNGNNDSPGHVRATRFAAGVPLQSMFTGTYVIGNSNDWCEYSKLDVPLAATRKARIVYPKALSGSGFIGRVGGYLLVNPDGSIDQAVATYGNELFQAPSQAALAQLRFTPPRKGSKPVKALVNFSWDIREPNLDTTEIVFK